MSDSVQQAYRFLVARFKKPEGNASSETAASHNSSTTTAASTSSSTNTSTTTTSTAPQREPAESFTDGSPPDEASTSAAVVVEGGEEEEEEEELVVSAVAVPGSPSLHSPTAHSVCTSEVNDPSDPSTSHVAEVQISDPSLSITDQVPAPVSEDHGSASPSGDHQQPPAGNDNNNNNNNGSTTTTSSTLSRSIAVTMNLTVNVRHHNHHHRHHLPPVHFIGAMDEQMQGAAAHGQHQHQHHHHHQHAPIGPIGVGFIEPVNPLLARARHRLYSLLLLRAAMAYFLAIPPIFRKCFEYSVLATAISAFALLIHLHVSLIRSPLTCLDHVADSWPRDGILRVQISMASSKDYSSSSPFDALHCPGRYISEEAVLPFLNGTAPAASAYPLPLTHGQWRAQMEQEEQARRQYLLGCPAASHSPFLSSIVKASDDGSASTERLKLRSQLNDSSLLKEADALRTLEFYPKKHGLWPQPYMVEYSLEYGLLRLSEEMRAHYNVPLKVVSLCPEEDACFGDPLARFILYHFLGYDDVLIGSIKRLAEKENNRGYVRNVATGEHFRFVNVWMTRASYIAAAFIMIVFTLFVSMLIRYSHQQVFVFVSEFLRTVEMQQPFSRITMLAASLITVVLALIGMEAIMFEFFNDSSIAFHVIIMVWAADQFDSMAARSAISKRHFLRFFYLYQFAFYAYHYRFNGQYAGLALMVTMLFTYHSMIFFFHHYELPLVQAMEEHIRFERRQRGGGGGDGTGGGGGNGADGANGSAGVEQPPREARSLDSGGPAEGGSESTTTSLGTPQTSTSAQTDTDSAVSPSSAPHAPSPPSSPPPSSLHTTSSPLPPAPPHHHHHPHHHHFTIRHQLCSAQCQSPLAASRFPFGAMNAAASQRLQPQQEQLPTDTFPTPVLEVD